MVSFPCPWTKSYEQDWKSFTSHGLSWHIYETERINTPGQKEVNELDYEFLEAERKVDAFFDEKYYEEEFHSTCPLVA